MTRPVASAVLLTLAAALAAAGCRPIPDAPAAADAPAVAVVLCRYGAVDDATLELARAALAALTGGPVTVRARPGSVPAELYDRPGVVDGDRFLAWLAARDRAGARVVALLGGRLSTRRADTPFGAGNPARRTAVVALTSLRPERDGGWRLAEPATIRRRLARVLVHEAGHAWGLGHCPQADCLMHRVDDLAGLDAQPLALCDACAALLATQLAGTGAPGAPEAGAALNARLSAFARAALDEPDEPRPGPAPEKEVP